MDMLAFLQDSSDDDSDKPSISETAHAKKPIHSSTTIACESARNKSKVRRRGCVEVISSSKARDSEIFSRSTPHRRGHWAGHVKIPILTKSLFDASLQRRKSDNVQTFRDLLERRGISGTLVEHECLHLSLSKEFSLQVAQIDSFVRQLANLVQQEHSMQLRIDSMSASELASILDNGSIDEILLLNEEKTRSFLCWTVHPNVTLRRIVAHIDNVMKSYKQPVYYKPAKFHVSIASFPGNLLEKLNAVNHDLANSNIGFFGKLKDDKIEDDDESSSSSSSESTCSDSHLVPVNELKCTLGTTKEFTIALK